MSRRRPTQPITLLQLAGFVSTLDRFAMSPMLVAIAISMDAPLSTIVSAAGVYFLVYGLLQPLWGFLADRMGRVATMRLTLLLAGLSSIAAAFTWSPISLAVTRGLAGGFFGAAYPSSLIYIGDTVPANVRQRDIARLMVSVALATALASVGAGAIADYGTWRIAFVITGSASVALAWGLRELPEPVRTAVAPSIRRSLRSLLTTPVALAVLLFAFADGAVLLGGITLMPPAIESAGLSASLSGAITAIYGIAVFVTAKVLSQFAPRWHPVGMIAGGGTAAAIGCALMAVSTTPDSAIVAAILLGIAWVSLHSTIQTWGTEVLPADRATMMSFFAMCMFVGSALGAILVAGLAEQGRFDLIFWGYAALSVPLLVGASVTRSRWRPPASAQ